MSERHSSPWNRALASAYADFIERHAGAVVIVFLVVTVLFGLAARRLELRTGFEDLLPEGQPSVVALRKIMDRVGGIGTLNIAVESSDVVASERFAEDLVAALGRRLPKDIRYLEYTVTPLRKFYERHGALYLTLKDLEEVDDLLADAIRRAKLRANPLYLDLEEEEEQGRDPEKRLRQLEDDLRKRTSGSDRFPRGYFEGEKGRLLVMFLRPVGSSLGIEGARELVSKVRRVVDEVGPERYHPSMKVNFTGTFQVSVEEYDSIVRDLLSTALLLVVLVALVVWLYFRLFRTLWLLGITLVGGAVWSFGLARLGIGYVNAQTAFLGSIIVGTGINYGIIILGRYLEERRAGATSSQALAVSLGTTFRPTLVAAIATGVSFGTLGIAHISSFSQFGFIGGLGIVICWCLSYTALPALLVLFERVPWLRLRSGASGQRRLRISYPRWLARLPIRHPTVVVVISLLLLAFGVVELVRFLPRSLETDVNNLRNKSSLHSGTAVLDDRVAGVYGVTLTPAIVIADSPEQARLICEAFDALIASSPKKKPVEWCRSIHSFLPDNQDEKVKRIGRIQQRLDATPRDLLPEDVRQRVEEMRARLDVRKLGLEDLPDEIRRRFQEKNGTVGTLVLVSPPEGRSLWIIENLYDFTDALREIRLADGQVIHSSGDAVVFADILRSIAVDAPRTTALAVLGVVLVLIVVLRRIKPVVQVTAALVAGVSIMAGLAAAFRVRYNFFNFVALPTTFGIGVDYPVNIHERYAQDGRGSMEHALCQTGPAVLTASLTTIIGYGVLLIGDNLALVSFGKLAILGEFTCLAAAMFLLPAIAVLWERYEERRALRRLGGPGAPPLEPFGKGPSESGSGLVVLDEP